MELDFAIASVIFIILVAWSYIYISGFFQEQTIEMQDVAERLLEKVIDSVSVDVYRIPAELNSDLDEENVILYTRFIWGDEMKNSTEVYLDNSSLPCMFQGDFLYWISNVSSGKNIFEIRFYNASSSLKCDSSLSIHDENKTIPGVEERVRVPAWSKIRELSSRDYEEIKNILSIENNFKIKIENKTYFIEIGPEPPRQSNVYVNERKLTSAEFGEEINIRVFVW